MTDIALENRILKFIIKVSNITRKIREVRCPLRWLDTVLKILSCSLLDIQIFGTGKFK